MSASPTLVIVIPTKDRRALLERALESVFSQSYAQYRVVIINDGSRDTTRAYLDTLTHPRLRVVHHEQSRGVNASRNEAYRTLQEGEWAVPLDDDDTFLPEAFAVIAQAISEAPVSVSVLQFNTIIQTKDEEYIGGRDFKEGEETYDFTYHDALIGDTLRGRGEPRPALRGTLFPQYLFAEEVNGFEGEWWLLVARDGVGIRYVNTPPVVQIDWRHEGEHLSDTAARRDPASFARAHARIFRAHHTFLAAHPRCARARAVAGMKIAVRARSPVFTLYFASHYLRACARLLARRGMEEERDTHADTENI